MSVGGADWALDQPLPSTQRLTLAAIAKLADDTGECLSSIADIVAQTGLARRTVQTALKALYVAGIVTVVRRGPYPSVVTIPALKDNLDVTPTTQHVRDGTGGAFPEAPVNASTAREMHIIEDVSIVQVPQGPEDVQEAHIIDETGAGDAHRALKEVQEMRINGLARVDSPSLLFPSGNLGFKSENVPPPIYPPPHPSTAAIPTQQLTLLPAATVTLLPVNNPRADFAEWWQRYPRKVAKAAAMKAYLSALRLGVSPQTLLDALDGHVFSDDPRFRPHPATWLNQGRWMDEPDEPEDYAAASMREADRMERERAAR